ncbi:MAG: GNAT family N-acetyltransferase [Candidatus Promineifilaceae bacterium]|nr:GNAT family N-acetyltransferase [Candidatus Promineifilaceae bacterium]
MTLEIERVTSERQLREFVKTPWTVYENDPNWVPWLYFERLEFFNKKKNPFFEHAEADYFIARRDGRAIGTIAAILNHRHNEFQQENEAHFGVFEVVDDGEAGLALLETAIDWARRRGVERIVGPMNLSTNDECGMLIEGFDQPPVVLMTYNPPYYLEMMEAAGFEKSMDLLAWLGITDEIVNDMPEKVKRVVGKVKERYQLEVRPIRMDDWDAEIDRIKKIYNSAWERNWGFVPMTDAEIEHMADGLKLILDPALIFMVEHKGEAVGFSLTLPDVNQPLRRIRPGPSALSSYLAAARLYFSRYKTDLARVMALGVIEKYRGRGVDALMYYETAKAALERDYPRLEASWILETNDMMNRPIRLLGGEVYKKYRVYEKEV